MSGLGGPYWDKVYRQSGSAIGAALDAAWLEGVAVPTRYEEERPTETHQDGLGCQADSRGECDNDAHWSTPLGPDPTVWLSATARSYHRSARRLERMENEADFGGLTVQQWSIVYRAIAGELQKCSVAVSTPGLPVDLDGDVSDE